MTYNSKVFSCFVLVGFGLASFKLAVVSIVSVLIYQLKQRNIDYLGNWSQTLGRKLSCLDSEFSRDTIFFSVGFFVQYLPSLRFTSVISCAG